jgi:hypothetical protein
MEKWFVFEIICFACLLSPVSEHNEEKVSKIKKAPDFSEALS